MERSLVHWLAAAIVSVALMGCGTTAKQIQMKSQSEKADIFTEVKAGETTPKGFADLTVRANIKTHLEGYYIGESKESPHGESEYPFTLNVDGQAVTWQVKGEQDNAPLYDERGKRRDHPEAGAGMKYVLEKRIRFAPGQHTFMLVMPAEDYVKSVTVTVKEGEPALLEFRPVYNYMTRPRRIPSFLKGIEGYSVFLNGEPVNSSG